MAWKRGCLSFDLFVKSSIGAERVPERRRSLARAGTIDFECRGLAVDVDHRGGTFGGLHLSAKRFFFFFSSNFFAPRFCYLFGLVIEVNGEVRKLEESMYSTSSDEGFNLRASEL